MSLEMAKAVVATLEKNYSRSFARAGLQKIWPDLVNEPAKAIEAAGDYFLLNSAFLPSPAILLARVQTEGKRIRSEQTIKAEREEKAKEPWSDGTALERAARDEHAKAALMCINVMRSNKTHAEKLEFYKVMEERYPSRGWGKMGAQSQRDVERCGRVLPVRGE